jgi:cell division protein FtsQ
MGLLITIAVLAILFLIALKLFTVKKVVVEGNELYDQKTIEDAVLNDKYSWNSLYVYMKYKVKDTKKIPFIDTMSISLDSPHTLHISVYEKGMLGYIYIPETALIIRCFASNLNGFVTTPTVSMP